jgi:hypothetical protein
MKTNGTTSRAIETLSIASKAINTPEKIEGSIISKISSPIASLRSNIEIGSINKREKRPN